MPTSKETLGDNDLRTVTSSVCFKMSVGSSLTIPRTRITIVLLKSHVNIKTRIEPDDQQPFWQLMQGAVGAKVPTTD